LGAKYDKAAIETSLIFADWFTEISNKFKDASDFETIERILVDEKIGLKHLNDFGSYLEKHLQEIYQFGRQAVNPNAKPLEFSAKPAVDIAFDLTPVNILAFLKNQSFVVAHISQEKVLSRMREFLENSIESGMTYEEFARNTYTMFEATGTLPIKPFHLQTVYVQNSQNVYQAGKLAELREPEMQEMFPVWEYVTIGDGHVRPNHAAMHGFRAPSNDPVWNTWYPPNGYNCRCDVEPVSEAEIRREPRLGEPSKERGIRPDENFETRWEEK